MREFVSVSVDLEDGYRVTCLVDIEDSSMCEQPLGLNHPVGSCCISPRLTTTPLAYSEAQESVRQTGTPKPTRKKPLMQNRQDCYAPEDGSGSADLSIAPQLRPVRILACIVSQYKRPSIMMVDGIAMTG